MEQVREQTARERRPIGDRLAGAPISWGACEVPGWGAMPDPETVLTEMASLGLRGTEFGPPGFLPAEPDQLRVALDRHRLTFVGAFTPVVLHERTLERSAAYLDEMIRLLAGAEGEVLVIAAVQDPEWARPQPLRDDDWKRLADHAAEVAARAARAGLTFALHPHTGTLIETAAQVQRALEELDPALGWCLDTGHLLIGGTDPAQFAAKHGERVAHVHLKDVDGAIAAELRAGRLSHLEATRQGVFRPLGRGDARVRDVLAALEAHEYDGWLVLEQDTAIAVTEPAANDGPRRDAAQSIAFINEAQTEERDR